MDLVRKAFDVPFAGVSLLDGPVGHAAQDAVGNAALFRYLPAIRPLLIEDTALDPRFDGVRVIAGGPPARFFAGVPIGEDEVCIGALCLVDGRPRRLSRDESELLVRMSRVAAALLRQDRTASPAQDPQWQAEPAALSTRYKKTYDRCSARARIGVWECDLSTEALTWTDGVYDLFDLPHGSPPPER